MVEGHLCVAVLCPGVANGRSLLRVCALSLILNTILSLLGTATQLIPYVLKEDSNGPETLTSSIHDRLAVVN